MAPAKSLAARLSGPASLVFVLGGHVAALVFVLWPHEAVTSPEPVVLNASLIVPPAPEEPPAPRPPTPPPPKPVVPPKPRPLIAARPAQPVPDAIVAPPDPPDPAPAEPVAAYAPPTEAAPPAPAEPPRFDADYLRNPPPAFPAMSKKLHEEGTVLLRVHVSASGDALSVDVARSSGYSRLDEAALRAVRQWKFKPSRRGDEAVDGIAMVPLAFSLRNG